MHYGRRLFSLFEKWSTDSSLFLDDAGSASGLLRRIACSSLAILTARPDLFL